ncbi:MAG TPA: hypothetical protein PKB02_02255 [Anaerohalosphaeraceae bacterium]|nr:hypothetical protein [Anaerohalosphaeraceae bacterium]
MKTSALTKIGLITVCILIFFMLELGFRVCYCARKSATRTFCGQNLRTLSLAMNVYAEDHFDNFPQLPGNGPWSKELGFAYDMKKPSFSINGEQSNVGRTITASWYLLVRYADVAPKTFLCPHATMGKYFDTNEFTEFKGHNSNNLALTDLWDLGPNPYNHINYAMHNPYGKYPVDKSRSVCFAVAADMSPWFYKGDILPPGKDNLPPQIIKFDDPTQLNLSAGNTVYHGRYGNNVLYADGHVAWETRSDVGIRNDNIYTYWSTDKEPTKQDIRGGTAPTGRTAENDAKSKEDSFLAI